MSAVLEKMLRMGVRRGSALELAAESWWLRQLVRRFPCWVVPCIYGAQLQIRGEEAKLRLWLIQRKWDPRVLQLGVCKESTMCFQSVRVVAEKGGIP